MIPLRELRIGNLVQKDRALHVVQENDFLGGDVWEGVEITSQILFLLGFEDLYENTGRIKYFGEFELTNIPFQCWQIKLIECIRLNSVHQLQNTFFYSTGTELDISGLLKARK